MDRIKGFFYGIITSITFGLIPLFTLPVLNGGMNTDSILFYRFSFATVALGLMMLLKKESFKIHFKKDVPTLLLLGIFYVCSAMFLLMGYEYMDSGIATSIHFTYPVFVTILITLLYHEKSSFIVWVAIFLAIIGVAVLSVNGLEFSLDVMGMFIVILSAVAYALYIIGVNKSHLNSMNGRKLAFYVFFISSVFFLLKNIYNNQEIYPIKNSITFFNLILLAVLPTVISNITLVIAVRNIGGTMTSVLGAMEPVTAVIIGAFIFGEILTFQKVLGIFIIITAVTMIILSTRLTTFLSTVFKKNRPRHA